MFNIYITWCFALVFLARTLYILYIPNTQCWADITKSLPKFKQDNPVWYLGCVSVDCTNICLYSLECAKTIHFHHLHPNVCIQTYIHVCMSCLCRPLCHGGVNLIFSTSICLDIEDGHLTLSPLKPVFMCWMLWHSAHKNGLQWWKG